MLEMFQRLLACIIIHEFLLKLLFLSLATGAGLAYLLCFLGYKKFWLWFCIGFSLPVLLLSLALVHDWFNKQWLRRSYYLHTYNEDKIRVVEDSNFRFYQEGYTVSYRLKSDYFTAHRILLIPETKSVPIDYEFDGELLVEIYDKDDGFLDSFTVVHPDKILHGDDDNYIRGYNVYISRYSPIFSSYSVFAFELGEIPFSIIRPRRGKLENLEIKITILKPDEKLKQYCDTATLIIIPDLRL